jgi:hypothetical protein
MLSKIFFLIALLLIVSWVILFLIFNTYPAIHTIAVLGVIFFVISFTTNNTDN